MEIPDWSTSQAGARIRVALWLHANVGVQGTFTKGELRQAFPKVEQIDRRMRDLRREGWVIATYREDRSLSPDELRLVKEGGPVWEPGYRSQSARAVSDKERWAIFAADNFCCVYCGISSGETYEDEPLRTAKLTLTRTPPLGGGQPESLTACDRCHVAARYEQPTADELTAMIDALHEGQRGRLRKWIHQGYRSQEPEERLWVQYQRLSQGARRVVAEYVELA